MSNLGSSITRQRWLGAVACLTMLAAFAAQGCGSDDKGTDIVVPAGGNAGSAGKSSSGGSNGKAGSSAAGSASQEGGAGGLETTGGESGTGGSTNGGTAGTGGGSGGKAGSGGTAGTGGGAGTGGASGSAGTAGGGGMAGSAGAGGKGGSGGTAGSGGTGGTAGSGGTGGTAGSGGKGGSGGAGTVCGDGKVEGAEECDCTKDCDASTWKGDPLCADDCETVATTECVQCEIDSGDCGSSSDNCLGPAATPFSLANVALCYDIFQCFQDSHCVDGANGSVGHCYCGDLDTAACGNAPFDLSKAGAPNGPCAELMQTGDPGLTSNTAILGAVTSKLRPAGAAGQRINCQKTHPECATPCGITL